MKELIDELGSVKLQLHNQRTGFGDTAFLKIAEKHLDKALAIAKGQLKRDIKAAEKRIVARAARIDPETGTFKKKRRR
jgi:hypothetical protein